MELAGKTTRIHFLLSELLNKLNALNDETYFFEKIGEVQKEIKELEKLKNELKNSFSISELKNYETEYNFLAKQIKERFDNIIEEKKQEISRVSEQIKNLQNSKKLTVYR